MSDDGSADFSGSYTEISQQSWLQQLAGSLIGAVVGLLLFLASFVVLFWNEGHAVAEMNSLNAGAKSVVSVPADRPDPANEGRLVHVTGLASVTRAAADPVFHVAPADALRLRRKVSAYQWEEHAETSTEKSLGGGETKRTTYTYRKVWSDKVINSSEFKQPAGHTNPAFPLRTTVFDAQGARLGGFTLDPSVMGKLTGFKGLAPPSSASAAGVDPGFRRIGDQFYHGAPDAPAIGDMQVSYEVLEAQPVSVVAAQTGQTLAPFRGKDGRVIEIADLGTHSADDLFHEAKAAASTFTWILRAVGFVMMLIGLCLLASPLAWLVSVLPFLEGVVDTAAFFLALVLSIPLTMITIAIAWMAYRPLLAAGLLAGGLVVAAGLRQVAPRRSRDIRPRPAPPRPVG